MNKSTHVLTGQLCLIELVAWGILYYTFSAFMPAMKEELGWSSASLATGFSVALLISGLTAPFVGGWIDRHGSRGLMISATIIGTAGIVLWSLSYRMPLYLSAWILIGISMAGILYAPAFATAVRFNAEKSRNTILVITLVGALASTVFIPLSTLLGECFGWRTALQLLATGLAIITLPLTLALPKTMTSTVTREKKDSLTNSSMAPPSFRVLTIALMMTETAGVAFNAYLVLFLIAQGQTTQVAATIAGFAGVAKIAGRLMTAFGRDYSAMTMLRVSLLVKAAALVLPVVWPSTWSMIAMIIGFGASAGARTVLKPMIVVEMYGVYRFATSNGLLQFYTTLSKSAGPVGLGLMVGVAGWSWSWGILASLVSISCVLLFTIRPAFSKHNS